MKTLARSILLLAAGTALAESPFERELAQLTAQRDKEISAANEPINRRYKQAMEGLLRRATQANDLDAALKIRQASGDPASPAATSSTPASAPTKVALTKRGLENHLEGTTWVTDTNDWLQKFTFQKGSVISNPSKEGKGRTAVFHAVDGATIVYPWDGGQSTISFSPDLQTCTRGPIQYRRQNPGQ
jgi:hypothetical protein